MAQTHPHDHIPNAWQAATQQNTQYYLHALHELIDMGMDFARQLHSRACPPPEVSQPVAEQPAAPSPAATQDLSIAFDRIARAIRRTIALAQKLSEPVEAKSAPRFGQNGTRKRNLRAVDDDFQPAEKDPSKMTDEELQESIDSLERDLDDELPDGPIADIITGICRDLGITHVPDTHLWKRCIIADLKAIITSPEAQALRNEAPPADRVVASRPHPYPRSPGPPPRPG